MKEPAIMLTSWGGAQYIDLWLIVHLLAGISLGYLLRVLGVSFYTTFIMVSVVLLGWELYEWVAKIPEPWTNSVLDIVVGVLGIWISFQIILFSSSVINLVLSGILLILWSSLGIWGWSAWRERERQLSANEQPALLPRLPSEQI